MHEKQKHEVKLQEELEGLKDSLRIEKQNLAEIACDRDILQSLCAEKDASLQVSVINFKALTLLLITVSIFPGVDFVYFRLHCWRRRVWKQGWPTLVI